ncbi:MAG: methylated-DNA--[protein]-cysteine S-methyltransferase [Planctomycetes bacterium]|nr:methylated-DNA--[protein]-cysteine S-methyltransferase [Planctomycetota bacterium]
MPHEDVAVVLPSDLGWIALVRDGNLLRRLTFGQRDAARAVAALDLDGWIDAEVVETPACDSLAGRLQAFAAGEHIDFSDIGVDLRDRTPLHRRVIAHCRRIPCGQTLSYGELAAQAGAPGAARAVGNIMAANRVPLVVPCHRVVAASGHNVGYSAGEGVRTKLRLLEMEALAVA